VLGLQCELPSLLCDPNLDRPGEDTVEVVGYSESLDSGWAQGSAPASISFADVFCMRINIVPTKDAKLLVQFSEWHEHSSSLLLLRSFSKNSAK
jgi:hypothetical protein